MKKLVLLLICLFPLIAGIAQSVNNNTNKDGAVTTAKFNTVTEFTGSCTCSNPMPADEFNQLVSDLKDKGTDRNMLFFAKIEISDKCLLASQVEEIMLLFSSTAYRNSFLAYAKKYTYDEINYYALRIKYPTSGSVVPNGQLYNNLEVNAPNNPSNHPKLNSNELNRNYISDGRKNEMQRELYYNGYVKY
jgi:hypothetical protein